jgi:ketosteroid isomerase-like protein
MGGEHRMTAVAKEFAYSIYEDFVAGRFDRLERVLDDNIDFISHAPTEVFPYLGRRQGRAQVLEALMELHRELEFLSLLPVTTVFDDHSAALTVVIQVRRRSTGRLANFLAAHFMRFRDDRLVEYSGIVDSLDLVRQLLGTGFNLNESVKIGR